VSMPKSAELESRRFNVEEYHRMAEAGILAPDERVELLFGVVHGMSPKSRAHVIAANRVFDWFRERLRGRASVYKEDPLRFEAIDSEPEPDVMVCSNLHLEEFGTEAMKPLLVIEVAESSLRRDLGEKVHLYARAGVPEYWVIDLVDGRLEVFREPGVQDYGVHLSLEPNARVVPERWPDLELPVSTLFPADAR
jgi:Uma2 family endonuclease